MMEIFSPFLVALDPCDLMRRYCPSSADSALPYSNEKARSFSFYGLNISLFILLITSGADRRLDEKRNVWV